MTAVETIELEVALLMRRAEATRRAMPGAANLTLDRAAYLMLRRLSHDGPANIGALAADLGLDASTVTRQVTAMEREGYVRRERDPHDGRGTVISPTSAGVTRLRAVRRARADLYDEILLGWSAADRAALSALLHRLNQSMDAHARLKPLPSETAPAGREAKLTAGGKAHLGQADGTGTRSSTAGGPRRGSPSSAK